jgi:predicted RNA-binding protein with PIN domain
LQGFIAAEQRNRRSRHISIFVATSDNHLTVIASSGTQRASALCRRSRQDHRWCAAP